MTDTTIDIAPAAAAFVEKAPLERYVAPKKPSLVGMTRAELGDALGRLGVPEGQRKMRVQQLWHWIYFRGFTSFDAMTSVSKDLRARFPVDASAGVTYRVEPMKQYLVANVRTALLALMGAVLFVLLAQKARRRQYRARVPYLHSSATLSRASEMPFSE